MTTYLFVFNLDSIVMDDSEEVRELICSLNKSNDWRYNQCVGEEPFYDQVDEWVEQYQEENTPEIYLILNGDFGFMAPTLRVRFDGNEDDWCASLDMPVTGREGEQANLEEARDHAYSEIEPTYFGPHGTGIPFTASGEIGETTSDMDSILDEASELGYKLVETYSPPL